MSVVELSVRRPALVLEGIRFRTSEGEGPAGAVDSVRLIGEWSNPLKGSIFTPVSLDVQGVDVALPHDKGRDGRFDPGNGLAFLFRFRHLSVNGSRLEFPLAEESGALTDFTLAISTPERDNSTGIRAIKGTSHFAVVGVSPSFRKATGEANLEGTVSPYGKAEGIVTCTMRDVSAPEAAFSALTGDFRFSFASGVVNLRDSTAEISGLTVPSLPDGAPPLSVNLRIPAAEVSLNHPYDINARVSAEVGDLFSADLTTSGSLSRSLNVSTEVHFEDVAKLLALDAVKRMLPVPSGATVTAKGMLVVNAQCVVPTVPPAAPKEWRVTADFQGVRGSVSRRGLIASATLTDKVTAEMREGRLSLEGSPSLSDVALESDLFRGRAGSGTIEFDGTTENISVKRADFTFQEITLMRKKPVAFKNVQISGTGVWDGAERNVREVSGRVTIDGLGPFQLAVSSTTPVDATVRAEGIEASAALALLQTVYPSLSGWSMQGKADLNLHLREDGSFSGAVALAVDSLSDPQGSYMAEKCAATANLKGTLHSFSPDRFTAGMRVEKGEALLKGLYFNFASTPLTCDVSAVAAGEGFSVKQGTLKMGNLASTTLASAGESLFPLIVKGRVDDLSEFNDRFIKPSFSTLAPSLNTLQVKGSLEWESNVTSEAIEGRIRILLPILEMEGPLSLGSIRVDLPVFLSRSGGPGPKTAQQGDISIGKIDTGRFRFIDQKIRLTFEQGKYHVAPFRVPLETGTVVISGLTVGNPLAAAPTLSMGVTLHDIPIGPLDLLPPPYKLEGTVNSREFEVNGSFDRLETNGRVIVDLFSGTAEIFDMAAEDILSPYRKFSCNLNYQSLDMEQLTRALSFGRITGKVSGFVHDMTIVNGQPEAFSFQLESVKTKGVPQRVSFNAVSDIQTISQGDAVGISLPMGLERFINDLGYDRIGISCVLGNDVFRVNGLIHKNGKEYFVSRSGLTGIDVVNVNPENQISFKDMVDRVKRVAEKRAMEVK